VEFAGPDVTFVELGPGSVLTGLVKRIDPDARRLTCGTVEEVESMMEMVA
jgi:[acyl-carrier-protein] S-malonyltransferase